MKSDDARLSQVIADYLLAMDEGRSPHPDEIIARHPELAEELRTFFADHARMTTLAAPLREDVTDRSPRVAGAMRAACSATSRLTRRNPPSPAHCGTTPTSTSVSLQPSSSTSWRNRSLTP